MTSGDTRRIECQHNLLIFGITDLGVFIIAWLMRHSKQFPRGLSYWGYLLAILQVVWYLGRLIILDAKNPMVSVDVPLSGLCK
jgi:hypothetical protein